MGTKASDILIENIVGYTHTQANATALAQQFSALLIRDGRVVTTKPEEINAQVNANTQRIDGKGQILLPGLIDAHGHIEGLAQLLNSVDLRNAPSAAAAAEQVQAFAKNRPEGQWIVGRGWNQERWPGKAFPTTQTLDALALKRPIILERVDSHALWVNSQALAIAGIDATTPDPAGGQIVRDSEGRATGILIDNAMSLVTRHLPKAQPAEQARSLDLAFEHLLSQGITGVHDAGIDQPMIDQLTARAKTKRCRCGCMACSMVQALA
ncbi:amidohydrolase [Simiduia sp. 21SJ11W-1]|uniref:amidohydrolase n=1 Tax=Simiduia sp. 21SJ11W-1 TaxID=2909669 RepID=UPI0020A0B550|nr:amidohydrolase family protein [Simiduia sp. 21SJ11W-1]